MNIIITIKASILIMIRTTLFISLLAIFIINPIFAQVPGQPTAIIGNTTVCAGSTQTYSVTPVSGASPSSYSWTFPSGWVGASSLNYINITSVGTIGGIVSVTAGNSFGSGQAQTLTVSIITAPAQPGSIFGNASFCPNNIATYSVTAVTGATSYSWSLPSGWAGTSATNSISTTTGTTGGTISVTANNSCGSSVARTLAVMPLTSPTQPGAVIGNTTMCAGTSQNYSISPVTGITSYLWTMPTGWTGTSTATSISAVAGTSGNISVSTYNGQCYSIPRTIAVTVTSIPNPPASISGLDSLCAGSVLTYYASPVSNATSYNWTLPTGWSGSSTTDNISITTGNSTGIIKVTASNNCGTSAAFSYTVKVTLPPTQPTSIIGNSNFCSGSAAQSYYISSLAGATSYVWSLPSGWSGTSTTDSITVTPGSIGGAITVKGLKGACMGQVQVLNITISSVPAQPSAIAGTLSICENSTHTYNITSVTNATSYIWTKPSGWTGTSTTNSIILTSNITSGNITVAAINSCGTGSSQILSITVNPLPAIPVITGAAGNVLTSSAPYGNQWYINGAIISGDTNTTYTASIGGVYSVVVTNNNGCSSASIGYDNTGINELIFDKLITLFPNPAREFVTISINTEGIEGFAIITNVLGENIRSINLKEINGNTKYSFDIKELDRGIYFITIQLKGRVITKKFIVE